MGKRKNILICPLEWGLGHAARMIPLARKLQELNNNVFIGAGEKHLALFRVEMNNVTLIDFSGFSPGYSKYLPQYLFMLLKTPLLLFHIIREHHLLKKIIRVYDIDIVISDNRFGLWNKKITSVYVTHMPRIPMPGLFRIFEKTGAWLHRAVMKQYSFCFIPDLPGEINLSGRLSHEIKLPVNVRYIGILSRFNDNYESSGFSLPHKHNTVILSGPEPQRSILKNKLISILEEKEPLTVILEGRPESSNASFRKDNILFYSHLPSAEMKQIVKTGEIIISRSGYTTIMDLVFLNCTGLLIPTPGQTEQEYLAEYLSAKGWIKTIRQKDLEKIKKLPEMKVGWPEKITMESEELLKAAINELLEYKHINHQTAKTSKKASPYFLGIMFMKP